eukprot:scaffold236632_cov19-Tisochrysis_lutea.AAC.3
MHMHLYTFVSSELTSSWQGYPGKDMHRHCRRFLLRSSFPLHTTSHLEILATWYFVLWTVLAVSLPVWIVKSTCELYDMQTATLSSEITLFLWALACADSDTVKPTFELHDMRPCGPYTAVARWTMVFPVVPDNLPRPWTPKVTFTGEGYDLPPAA